MNRPNWILPCAAIFAAALFISAADATTVERVTVSQMLGASDFVFHGTVEDIRVLRVTSAEDIVTRVRFRVHDVIKGRIRPAVVQLDFAGGTFAGLTISYAEQRVPILGEEGIYFVESLSQRMLNPLYGWSQGHFTVRYEDKQPVVYTADLRRVYDVQPGMLPRPEFSEGTASGIMTDKAFHLQLPMTLTSFKAKLRSMLGDRR